MDACCLPVTPPSPDALHEPPSSWKLIWKPLPSRFAHTPSPAQNPTGGRRGGRKGVWQETRCKAGAKCLPSSHSGGSSKNPSLIFMRGGMKKQSLPPPRLTLGKQCASSGRPLISIAHHILSHTGVPALSPPCPGPFPLPTHASPPQLYAASCFLVSAGCLHGMALRGLPRI